MDQHRWRRASVLLILLAGCSQTSNLGPPSTLAPLRTIDVAPPTSVGVAVTATNVTGYVNNVPDGQTFDISVGPDVERGLRVSYIAVPPPGTCEGTAARDLLAALIFGKQVSIDGGGFTFVGDIDVGLAMIQYGQAQPTADAPAYYQENAKLATPFNCANTTTSTTVAPVVVVRPRPTRPATTEAPAETEPVPVETVVETAPPVAQPPAVVTTGAPRTDPKPAEPAPVATEPDRTPREPATPRLPDPPASG